MASVWLWVSMTILRSIFRTQATASTAEFRIIQHRVADVARVERGPVGEGRLRGMVLAKPEDEPVGPVRGLRAEQPRQGDPRGNRVAHLGPGAAREGEVEVVDDEAQ